jgi:prepilin-type N-terminal cleavage/methylation domain-containing protein
VIAVIISAMNTPPLRRRSAAFTLIELLTVISIIVILMALTIAATRGVNEAAKRAKAMHTSESVTAAVKSYHVDYGIFPPLGATAQPSGDIVVGDPVMGLDTPNNALFYTLRNIPSGVNQDFAANPRHGIYYEDRTARVNAKNEARDGFYDQTINGGTPPPAQESCLYDPWGHQYGIIIDANGDDRIDLQNIYSDFTGAQASGGRAPRWKVGVFSMGKDGKLGTEGDRVYRTSASEHSDDRISWE